MTPSSWLGGARSGTVPPAPARSLGDGNIGRISWALEEDANQEEFLYLFYTATSSNGRESQGSEWILLERTRASVGGERVWFACPCCERRVRKLYLPPSSRAFWCRNCHHLSYRTRQWRLRPFERMLHLQKQVQVLPLESPSWRGKARELERVEESVPALGPMPSYEDLVRPYEAPPKRRPGRPSKAQERERARIEREAAQALTLKRPPGRPKVKRPYTRRTPFLLRESMSESDAFCVKCRDRREIKEPRAVSLANGRSALQGACPVCATLLTRIVKAQEERPGPRRPQPSPSGPGAGPGWNAPHPSSTGQASPRGKAIA